MILKGSHGVTDHPSELHVFVDARTGEVIHKWDAICEGIEKEPEAMNQASGDGGMEQTLANESGGMFGAPILPVDQTFKLHSKPGASKVIYLDFDGHTTTGTAWNTWKNGVMGASFYSPPYNYDGITFGLSDIEKVVIQRIWQMVSVDFASFDVDVTTQEPPLEWLIKSDETDVNYGKRVVITRHGPFSNSTGGIAFIDSFNWNVDTPCFVYNWDPLSVSEAISHEVGHTLGLSHDGTFDGTTTVSYYFGTGSEEHPYGWAPIMGVGYYRRYTTWDNGVYYQSNNTGSAANFGKGADDIAVITGYNGFSSEQDRETQDMFSAPSLNVVDGWVNHIGKIQTAEDVDWFRIELTEPSDLDLRFDPDVYQTTVDDDGFWGGSVRSHSSWLIDGKYATNFVDGINLRLSVNLYDGSGYHQTSNDSWFQPWLFRRGLPAGTYYISVEGVGAGDPTQPTAALYGGFSDYGSMGLYRVRGTIAPTGSPASVPVVTLALANDTVTEDGNDNLIFTFTRSVVTSEPLTVSTQIDGSAIRIYDFTYVVPYVTFAPNSATATLIIDPTADFVPEGNESVKVKLNSGFGYTIGTAIEVVGTILDDEPRSSTQIINVTQSTQSVYEDSGENIVFTFTRTEPEKGLTISYTNTSPIFYGPTAEQTDFTVNAPSVYGSVTFAPGVSSVNVTMTPIKDPNYELTEYLFVNLSPSSAYSVGPSAFALVNIMNDDTAPALLKFTYDWDKFSPIAAKNIYKLVNLTDALCCSGRIDYIDNLRIAGDAIERPTPRSRPISPKILGAVQTLDANGIAALLNARDFPKNSAATFTFKHCCGVATFIAINDGVSGFNPATDAVINITNYYGNLSDLKVY